MKDCISASLFCLVLGFCTCAPSLAALPAPAQKPPNCASLRETLTHPRWMSLPNSRLVINPFLGQYGRHDNGAGGAVDGFLPLNLAYYVGNGPVRLPAFWFFQPTASSATSGLVVGPRLSLSDAAQWQTSGVSASFGNEAARVTPAGDYGAIVRTVTVDLDKTPDLFIATTPGSPSFDLKVNSGDQPVDTYLPQHEQFGGMSANVVTATGWHGTKTFKALLYALGKNRPTTFTRVQFFRLPNSLASATSKSVWMPQVITKSASLSGADGRVYSAITMPDTDTVSQRLHIGPGGPSSIRLAGQFTGMIRWGAARKTLLLQGERFRALLCVSRRAQWLGVRPTQLDWAQGASGQGSDGSSGVWRMALDGIKPGDDIIISARFAPSLRSTANDAVRAQTTPAAFAAAVKRNEAAWNRRLARVPRPLDFTPRSVDAKHVTATDVRRSYYRAWVFFYANTLPPMPEKGFPYPQVCAGKPSLWTEGATYAPETALWDSLEAMQALALVDPQNTWAAAEGIMSQVGPDGYINGEALPTTFAQTIWLLYQQTGNLGKLRAIYPALKRYLLWKIANPRWIFPNRMEPSPDPNAPKDQEFVSLEIVDTEYAVKIAEALGRGNEVAFWRQAQQTEVSNYQRWFWPPPGGHVYRIYNSNTNRSAPDNPWNLQGLQISQSLLPSEDSVSLVALYKKTMNSALPFLVPGRTRFGDLEPITLGLFRHGQAADAAQLSDACMRDVTRAGEFSEDYTQSDPPAAAGVRPSSFGAKLMTDSVFWHNGIVLDEGLPLLIGMPGAVGVDNIPVGGDVLNVHYIGQTVTLSGTALRRLPLPHGFRAVRAPGGGTVWHGTIGVGEQIALEKQRM